MRRAIVWQTGPSEDPGRSDGASNMTTLEPIQPACLVLAYLDPGSGVVLAQMLLAGIAGIGLFLKYQGRRLLTFLGLRKRETGDDSDAS